MIKIPLFKTVILVLIILGLIPTILSFDKKNKNVGIQLFTLREDLPKDVQGVIEHIAKAGYTEVETYGFSAKNGFYGKTAKEFKNLLSKNGLKATSGHYDLGTFLKDGNADALKSSIEAAKTLGSEYVTIPWIDESYRKTAEDYKKIAQRMNDAGELCKKAGLRLAYHNHDFEFKPIGNTTGYEILLKKTNPKLVDFELDLYWVVRSGNNPIKLFEEHPGRFKMWHVKDMSKTNENQNAEIGKGSIDFKAIFAKAKIAGMKHYFVEQETNYIPNPLESIKTSYNYVDKL